MSTPRGYSSQEKEDRLSAQFQTVEPVRELQFGSSVVSHQYVYEVATDAVEAGTTDAVLVATGHAARKGDVIRLTSGALAGYEAKVWSVAANSISLAETLPSAPVAAVTFQILRHKYPTVEATGEVKVSGVFAEVATAADGGALPAVVKVVGGYDGAAVQVLKTDAAGELQVDVLSSALPAGAATSAIQTDGSQKTQIVDGSGNVIGSTGNALDVNLKSPITVDVSLSQANDSVAVFGSDGAVNRAIKTDANGELQIDVLSSALPAGAATETTLGAVKTAVEIIDNAISGNEMQVDVKLIEGVIDANNTTTTPLLAGGNFTGAWTEVKDYNSINLGVFSDVGSATDGLRIEYSFDGVSVHHFHLWTFPGGANGIGYQLAAEFRYFRVNYTNGASPQTTFLIQSNLKPTSLFPSSYRASQTFTSQSQVMLTKGIIVGETTGGGGGYIAVKVNPSGALTVESTLAGLDPAVLGQDTMANSLPVVLASDQTTIPVTVSQADDSIAVYGNDGTTNRVLKTDAAGELQIDVLSSALPSGAATETTLAAIKTAVELIDNTVSGSELQVDIVASLPAGTATIGKVDVNTLSVVDLLDAGILDTSSTNIAGSASSPTQVVASTAAAVKKLQILDTTGAFIGLYTGAVASEVLQLVIGPGSDQTIEHSIPASTRISLKRLDSTTAVSSGIVAINFIG